jgi:hypothetical protein
VVELCTDINNCKIENWKGLTWCSTLRSIELALDCSAEEEEEEEEEGGGGEEEEEEQSRLSHRQYSLTYFFVFLRTGKF